MTLAVWDAVETATRIRNKHVTAREVIDAAIARSEEASRLGAVVTPTYERARMLGDVAGAGPLAGVPTFIKDLAQVWGVPTTWGSRAAGHYVSRRTDVVVRRLRDAGLVSLGKSATPELGLTATTEPLGRPPCRNPWDPARSAGGSSGGAAALVASGVVPIAHASDGGGSIRIPAAACGLVGLKPSRFRLDMEHSNLLPLNLGTDGVLTRSVRDTVAFYGALESSGAPARLPPIGAARPAPVRALEIAVFVDAPHGTPVHADHRRAVLALGELCESLGHHVETIACPFEAQVVDDFLRFWGFLAWIQKSTARVFIHRGFEASKIEPWSAGIAAYFTREPRAALAAIARLRRFGRSYAKVMESRDVLLCPASAHPPPALGYLAPDLPFETLFERLPAYNAFAPFQNVAGAPAISIPAGRTGDGLPIGAQLAGAHGADRLLLELASQIEEARPWPKIAPREAWAVPRD